MKTTLLLPLLIALSLTSVSSFANGGPMVSGKKSMEQKYLNDSRSEDHHSRFNMKEKMEKNPRNPAFSESFESVGKKNSQEEREKRK